MVTSATNTYLGQFSETVSENLGRPFTVSGRRGYLVGYMDGTFPDLGHHIPGEMGGLWTPPVKLADGWWFGLREAGSAGEWEWLCGENTHRFTMSPGGADGEFAVKMGEAEVTATTEIFMAAHDPACFVSLTLANPTGQTLKLALNWLVRFELRGAWWSEWPDRPDNAVYNPADGSIVARDSLTSSWGAFICGDRLPVNGSVGANLWGPEKTGSVKGSDHRPEGVLRNPAELQGEGISGQLTYAVELAPNSSQTLHFVVAGNHHFDENQAEWAGQLLANRAKLLAEKLAEQTALLEKTPQLKAPRADYRRIFDGSALCLDLLTQDMPNLGLGIMAGLQGFAWYFGCDTYYTLSGLLVSGQAKTGIATLRLLANYGKHQRGRIPHEIVQTGELYNAGNQVETGEFATSVERAFRWTGDREFLAEVYPVVVEGIFKFLLEDSDPEGTLLPEGPGLLELSSALRGRKLDVAASLYQGLQSLAYLAGVMNDADTKQRCEALVEKVREQIEKHFWDKTQGEYVWRIEHDLSIRPGEPTHSYVNLEFGVEQGAERAARMFELVEGSKHTGPRGIILPGSKDLVMAIQNAIVALAEFRYNRPDEGLRYLQFCADEYAYYMPWAIPEFIGHDSCFIQAWSSATFNWLAVQGFFRLNPDPARGVIEVRPQLPKDWPYLEVKNLRLWGAAYDLRLDRQSDGPVKYSWQLNEANPAATPAQFEVSTETTAPVSFV
jgi:hypothetical protein